MLTQAEKLLQVLNDQDPVLGGYGPVLPDREEMEEFVKQFPNLTLVSIEDNGKGEVYGFVVEEDPLTIRFKAVQIVNPTYGGMGFLWKMEFKGGTNCDGRQT